MTDVITLEKMLKSAFNLGQEYWRLADSESFSDHKRADIVYSNFQDLLESVKSDTF